MVKKLCPVCDGTLKPGNICPVCRRWVRNPNMVDVNYYLNERHPARETARSYHDTSKKTGGFSETGKKPVKEQKKREGMEKEGRRIPSAPLNTGKAERKESAVLRKEVFKKKKGNGTGTVVLLVVLYALLMFGLPLLEFLVDRIVPLFG